jgi:hypothetical protein
MESVIPKSMNTALATIFASIVLGIEPIDSLPSSVLHRHFNGSSDLRTMTVTGMGVGHRPRLFSNSQVPLLPSLNEIATGTIASFVKVAHPTVVMPATAIRILLIVVALQIVRYEIGVQKRSGYLKNATRIALARNRYWRTVTECGLHFCTIAADIRVTWRLLAVAQEVAKERGQ